METLDIGQIQKILIHRYPFLLVDKVINLEPGKKGTGIKNVTINEEFFSGHFPEEPIMPGVLIIEAMAQVAAIVVGSETIEKEVKPEEKIGYLAGIKEIKFKRPVRPGDRLEIKVEIVQKLANLFKVKGEARVDEKVCAQGELVFTKGKKGY
ncbi:3-hydroxyacyl-ACP dehydratase FabZ [bacterium]|nr:3-hydroxyacyl-ACP dehydratase FabZ [bacterium]MCG2676227.1 3-hydroxyacyl-ACP dehydratase FabZ [bacterium]